METRTLSRPSGRLVYDRHGGSTGTPVVCVPGLGDTRASFRHLAPALAAAGCAVYVLDLRGHGDSDTTFTGYAAHDIGADIVALLAAEDLHGAVLVGNSIGGGAACWAAVEAPARVSRLVLLNPFVRDMPADRWLRPLVPLLFAWPWGVWAWGRYRQALFTSAPPDHVVNHAAVLSSLSEPGRLAATRAMLRASKAPVAARLGDLTIPSLVVMGALDPDYPDPAAEADALRGLLGGPVSVVLLDETGHYPQSERPAAVTEHILALVEADDGTSERAWS